MTDGDMKEETISIIESCIGSLSVEAREGLLFLSLIEGKVPLIYLSELVQSTESIDELVNLPFLSQVDSQTIEIEPKFNIALLQKFKWSEKVKASEVLANYFQNKPFSPEKLGDLWILAGKKVQAKSAFLLSLNHYTKDQFYPLIQRVGEKLLNMGLLSKEEEIEILQSLLFSYECCGELPQVIQTRQKLLENPLVKEQQNLFASHLRALAIDYSKQENWSQYKQLRMEAAVTFRKNNNFKESAGEFIALALKAIDDLNLTKGYEFSDEALKDGQKAGLVELICKSKAIKSYVLAMDGQYKEGQKLAQEALELALRNNLLETAAFVYRKLAGTYEYASDYEQAKIIYNKAIHFCENERMNGQMQMCYSCLSWIFLRLGEWKKAIEVCTTLIQDPSINNPSKSTAHCVIAIIKSLRGEIISAEKHTLQGIFLAQKEHFMLMYHLLHLPMAKINELKENPVGAKEWYCKIIDEWPEKGEKHDVLISLMDAAMFFWEQKDQSSLKKCLEITSYICKETGNSEALGCMAYDLGLDALLNGQHLLAINRLVEAKKHLMPLRLPYQLILVDYPLAICYLSIQDREMGQSILSNILGKAKKMGLTPMATKINKAINSLSFGNESKNGTLTKRQLDVLQLLSEGLSNKQIAGRLFLSPRTVDMHIRLIFDRLYCHTRTEAVRIGVEKGLIH
jgi:DNA-binding CsgD family transcriptional regulator/tetratricopeptide (TPR) repeat protein